MNFNNMSVEQIIARIEEAKDDSFEAAREICNCLVELNKRKVSHPLHKDRVYRWYKDIAAEKLHPGIAMIFNGNPRYIEHVLGRPLDLQKGMVAGREYDVVYEWSGELKEAKKSIMQMSLGVFQRLFPKGQSPATVKQQTEALKKEISLRAKNVTKHGPIVRADRDAKLLYVGTTAVPLSVVRTALKEIGLDFKEFTARTRSKELDEMLS